MFQANTPFSTAAVKTVRTKNGCRTRLNPEDLEVCNDPIPEKRHLSSQYDVVFEQMKVGQCIKVEPKLSNLIARNVSTLAKRLEP